MPWLSLEQVWKLAGKVKDQCKVISLWRVIDKNLVSSAKHIRNVIDLSHLVHVTKTIPLFPVGKLDASESILFKFFPELEWQLAVPVAAR